MRITGELLKNERINQGLSISQVSQALKLSQKIIIALEAGDESQLPAKAFIRGFVKGYAQFLKLDADAVLRQFQEEMGSTSPLPKIPPPPPVEPENIRAPKPTPRQTSKNYTKDKSVASQDIREQDLAEKQFNNKILLFLFAAAGLVLLIVAATRFFESDEAPPVAAVSDQSDTNVIAPQFNNIDPAAIPASTETTSVAALPSSDATSATATLTSGASATATAAAPLQNPESAKPEEELPASSGKPIELVIEARKDIEIFYAAGNTKIFKSLKLPAQSVQIIRSANGLHIKAQDGGAFKVTANGIDKGLAGANNKPVRLSF